MQSSGHVGGDGVPAEQPGTSRRNNKEKHGFRFFVDISKPYGADTVRVAPRLNDATWPKINHLQRHANAMRTNGT